MLKRIRQSPLSYSLISTQLTKYETTTILWPLISIKFANLVGGLRVWQLAGKRWPKLPFPTYLIPDFVRIIKSCAKGHAARVKPARRGERERQLAPSHSSPLAKAEPSKLIPQPTRNEESLRKGSADACLPAFR